MCCRFIIKMQKTLEGGEAKKGEGRLGRCVASFLLVARKEGREKGKSRGACCTEPGKGEGGKKKKGEGRKEGSAHIIDSGPEEGWKGTGKGRRCLLGQTRKRRKNARRGGRKKGEAPYSYERKEKGVQ